MKFITLIRRFVPPYKGQMALNILFNLLSTVLSLFSFAAIIPVLRILFGLTEAEVEEVAAMVTGLKQEGQTIIWIEHILDVMRSTTDRLLCISEGRNLS